MNMNFTGNTDQLWNYVPGGIARLALDDQVTILYASDTFYSLIENATENSDTNVPPSLLKIVYSADIIYVTQQLAVQKHKKDNQMINLNFRTLQPDGRFRWVMISGIRTEEVYQSGTKTVPVYYCIAMDATEHMLKYKKIERELDYHRTITDLSKELFFEYEIATDTLTFGELFREVFGRDSVIKGFSNRLEKTKLIHPDELPAVIKIFKSMMNGRKQVRFEVRLIPRDGVPVWYICYASIIFDENRNPHKVVGKLAAVCLPRKDQEHSVTVPELDPLTKVYTKQSAEKLIVETMSKQDPESLSALMLFEVRNYKITNEVMKSVSGDDILATIAGFIKTRFRSSDIIGRLSASEFAVYLKDIRSDRNAYEKAEQLCKEVEGVYTFGHNRNGLCISIGIAFTKGGQMDYPSLLANAKAALVIAKKENSSSFEVFYNKLSN